MTPLIPLGLTPAPARLACPLPNFLWPLLGHVGRVWGAEAGAQPVAQVAPPAGGTLVPGAWPLLACAPVRFPSGPGIWAVALVSAHEPGSWACAREEEGTVG